MQDLTPEQKEQLETWAGQRDSLLSEISNLITQKEILIKKNKDISDSSSEIETRMNQNIGRIEELSKKEKEITDMITIDSAKRLNDKTKLESEIANYTKLVNTKKEEYDFVSKSLNDIKDTFKVLSQRVGVLDQVVDTVTRISSKNIEDVNTFFGSFKENIESLNKTVSDISEKSIKNSDDVNSIVSDTKEVLSDIKKIKKDVKSSE